MTGAGKAYELCGAMWEDEFKLCTNVAGHFGTVGEGKFGLAKVRCNCKRISCPVCYPKACALLAMRISDHFLRMPAFETGQALTQNTLVPHKNYNPDNLVNVETKSKKRGLEVLL